MPTTLMLLFACGQPAEPSAPTPAASPTIEAPAAAPQWRFIGAKRWDEQSPDSPMRVAQWTVPGEGGDAELVVYWFGGGGGSVEANFARWAGQFDVGGGDPMAAATTGSFAHAGATIHTMSLSGRFVAETAPGSGEHVDQPDQRLLGAIIEGGDGPYFVKLVGPKATVDAAAEEFQAVLDHSGPR